MRERILDNISQVRRHFSVGKVRNRVLAAFLVSGSLILCAPLPATAGSEGGLLSGAASEDSETSAGMPEQQPVSLIVSYGYEDSAKGGRCIPVSVTIRNQRSLEEEMVLRIKSMESDGSIYCYDYDVALEPFGEQSERYHIPIGTDASQLFLELKGKSGEVLASRLLDLDVSRDVPELFIGVLSDDLDGLDYLNGIGINYSAVRTRTFSLDPEEFPKEQVGLDLLDVLVVNNFKLRDLSEEQTSAIMDWVHSGGVLLLGTGERVGDTLGRFAPELLDDSYATPALRPVNLSEDFALSQPGDGMCRSCSSESCRMIWTVWII